MKFESKYRTPDGFYELDVDAPETMSKDNLKMPTWNDMLGGISPKNATKYVVKVYNTATEAFSKKQIYVSPEGRLFFRGRVGSTRDTQRYFIDELIKL